MPGMPARCSRCGYVDRDPGSINIDNSTNVRLSGNVVSGGCQRCGGPLQVIEGVLDILDGAVRMRSGPQWSWDVVEALRLTLKRVVDEGPEDLIAPVERVNPPLGKGLRRATRGWTRDQVLGLITTILAILTWVGATPHDIVKWVSDAEHQVQQMINDAARKGPPG